MKKGTRMLLMGNKGKRRTDDTEYRDGYTERSNYDNYGVDDKFRDRRGREHYDNGRYAPMNDGGDVMWVDSRQRRDSRGRFTNEYGDYRGYPYYDPTPYVPPVYERYGAPEYNMNAGDRERYMRDDTMDYPSQNYGYRDSDRDRRYKMERAEDNYSNGGNRNRPMNKIGFAVEGEMERIPSEFDHDYSMNATHENMDEMAYRHGSKEGMMGGRAYSMDDKTQIQPLTRETAMEWTQKMKNADGTTGPHWTMNQTQQVMTQHGLDCDPVEFWVALNATYSDFCKALKKYGISTIDAYVDFAKAFWMDDKDAEPNKLARYYEYIVKH